MKCHNSSLEIVARQIRLQQHVHAHPAHAHAVDPCAFSRRRLKLLLLNPRVDIGTLKEASVLIVGPASAKHEFVKLVSWRGALILDVRARQYGQGDRHVVALGLRNGAHTLSLAGTGPRS